MSDASSNVLVVIPALNEEASVSLVIERVRDALPAATCLVVDDGSSDATTAAALEAGAEVLAFPVNLGVGGAMRAGFRYAVQNGYGVAVQVDADGQHDPSYIPALIERLADEDIVIGARFAGTGEYQARGPRRWAMKMLAIAVSRVARSRLTDATSGFKAHGDRAIRLFAHTYPAEYLGDTIEALVIAARAGLRIGQIPVEMRVREAGEPSHGPLKSAVYLFRAVAAFGLALMRRPIVVPGEGGK